MNAGDAAAAAVLEIDAHIDAGVVADEGIGVITGADARAIKAIGIVCAGIAAFTTVGVVTADINTGILANDGAFLRADIRAGAL